MKIFHNIHGWINNEIPVVGEKYLVARKGKFVDGVLTGHGSHTAIYKDPSLVLDSAKTARIARVKVEADERIKALDWQLSRAYRHSTLGAPQKKTELAVLRQQQDIEEASDTAEAAITLLVAVAEVEAFTW